MIPLADILTRALGDAPARGFRSIGHGAVHYGTDIGLRREENQDRVAVIRWQSDPRTNRGPMCAVVISDGMGGMLDGGKCAARTVAAFLSSLITSTEIDVRDAIITAANLANEGLFETYRGRGGATLSAVVYSARGNAFGVNVGDSRIYSPVLQDGLRRLNKLTIDDSLRDAFGSSNADLLQYIGLGDGLRPHLIEIPHASGHVAITTDGAHFFDEALLSELIMRSPDTKAMCDRVVALSRWLGAPDNATIAAVDVGLLRNFLAEDEFAGSELWTAGMDGPVYLYPYDFDKFWRASAKRGFEAEYSRSIANAASVATTPSGSRNDTKASRTSTKKRRSPKKSSGEQLMIDVEVSEGKPDDADR